MNRVRVFIDYWNFQLTIQKKEGQKIGIQNHRFSINWKDVGRILAEHACRSIGLTEFSYEGVGIYTSYNPNNDQGKKVARLSTQRFHHTVIAFRKHAGPILTYMR